MTVTTIETWWPNATNRRLVTKRVSMLLSAELADPTAAELGLASILDISNARGADGIGYAGFVFIDGSQAVFYTDGAGAAWTGSPASLSTTLYFTVTGVPLD